MYERPVHRKAGLAHKVWMVAGAFQQAAQGLEKALTIESAPLLPVEQMICHDVA